MSLNTCIALFARAPAYSPGDLKTRRHPRHATCAIFSEAHVTSCILGEKSAPLLIVRANSRASELFLRANLRHACIVNRSVHARASKCARCSTKPKLSSRLLPSNHTGRSMCHRHSQLPCPLPDHRQRSAK
ncbi:hypothetical protein HBI29_228670 [Parastagonospora nodorum]|nr:hypothetical protein HBI71_218780 [Parastagonospora nodorum]KAH5485881.1 hypothetical protein HBI29_228670 [Parastagonospora nodorum]KAH6137032.1 hypothetical protein HBI68_235620 [Parastagonospora nodorum]KAH6191372.1 hypothetical protein HBI53_225440 [Parastagonospora nodorum]KAH6446895.1 hypothetical protein HBI57_219270 [Parastagonospora nodorum]